MNSLIRGVGLGLRQPHMHSILESKPEVPWFEVIVDDYIDGHLDLKKLDKLRKHYPIVCHSVGLNLGGIDEYDTNTLSKFKYIYDRFSPEWISDHLCWSSHNGMYHHDLMPIPRTTEALEHIVRRIDFLQNFFKRSLVIENITQYIRFENEQYSENEFISEVMNRTGCFLLLDISNIATNMKNKINENYWVNSIDVSKVKQIHLAGSVMSDGLQLDTHSENVSNADTLLAKDFITKNPHIPVMIERDSNLPNFSILNQEREYIEKIIYEL